MSINETYTSYVKEASLIPGFKVGRKEDKDITHDIEDLANGYVKAMRDDDEEGKSRYIAALMVRYWHMVPYLYESSKTLRVSIEDIPMWLYMAFQKACDYHSWLNPEKAIYGKPKAAEKCINQCITSVRAWWFKNLNQYKRKVNATTCSLDIPVGDDDSCTLLDMQRSGDDLNSGIAAGEVMEYLVDNGNIFNALIVDGIINQDVYSPVASDVELCETDDDGKERKVLVRVKRDDFSLALLCRHLRRLDGDFVRYFEETYDVDHGELEDELFRIASRNANELRADIKKALNELNRDEEVRGILCC